MAVLNGLIEAKERGILNVTIRTDYSNVIQALRQYPNCAFDVVVVCSEIFRLALSMENVMIIKGHRDCVRTAHDLAVGTRRMLK